MWEATRNILAKSPIPDAEEWAIHDHEGFAFIRINEYDSFERVAELAAFIAEHGALGAEIDRPLLRRLGRGAQRAR